MRLIIISSITVAVWIAAEVYEVYKNPALPKISTELTAPINPSLNEDILNSLPDKSPY